tara:strand:+ start:14793 stop:15587 length:795 start_codon:yes stop_codon:yes gene_type:complete
MIRKKMIITLKKFNFICIFKNTPNSMVTKNQINLIRQIKRKRNRKEKKLFIVEGKKSIDEFLTSNHKLYEIYSTHPTEINTDNVIKISDIELSMLSSLKKPNKHIAIFYQKNEILKNRNFYILFDRVSDPGNLGTILRTCHWFGVDQIVCSKDSVDCYNSKVVQSSMGSLSKVNIVYTDLIEFIKKTNKKIFAASLSGKSIIDFNFKDFDGILVFGSESNGLSEKIKMLVDDFISIPNTNHNLYPNSLNLSISVAIFLSKINGI